MIEAPVKYRKRKLESKEYYRVRAKIMKECYLNDWNAKEIAGYFNIAIQQVYKFCKLKKLKVVKVRRAYKELILRDLILKDNGKNTGRNFTES